MPVLSRAVSVGHLHDIQALTGGVVLVAISDSVQFADAIPGIRAFLSVSDTAHLADSISQRAFVSVAEAIHLADALSLKGFIALVDTIHLTDGVAVINVPQIVFVSIRDRIRLDDGAQALPKGGRPWYPVDRGGF